MQAALEEVLFKKKQRTIAEILGALENSVKPQLDAREWASVRKLVLDKINDLFQLIVDVADTLDDGDVVLNEHYLEKLDAVHQTVQTIAPLLISEQEVLVSRRH